LITRFVHSSTNRLHRRTRREYGAVVGERSRKGEGVGSNLGSKQVKNKSCELWSVLSPPGYINFFFLFLLNSKWFLKKLKIIFRDGCCKLWPILNPPGYIKNIFFLFLLNSKCFLKKFWKLFLGTVDLSQLPLKIALRFSEAVLKLSLKIIYFYNRWHSSGFKTVFKDHFWRSLKIFSVLVVRECSLYKLRVDRLASCFFPHLKEVFHVNYYDNCTYDCSNFTANLMVDVALIFHHNMRDGLVYCCCHFSSTPHAAYSYAEVWALNNLNIDQVIGELALSATIWCLLF
jgi:hypothetical protein